ncbi:AMP nucleosidase [Ewingella americana]|nr:AMP nucleosidase [Ewingella americana]
MPYFVLSLAHLHKGTILNNAYSATQLNATEALDRLEALYNGAVVALRTAIGDFIHDGSLPDNDVRSAGLFTYPELSVSWDGAQQNQFKSRAYGRFPRAGKYTTTITRPELFRGYLADQLSLLESEYNASFVVKPSQLEIPFPFVIDGSDLNLDRTMSAALAHHFPTTELSQIGDQITDGLSTSTSEFPLSHFDALRTDFSLARLKHYTGTPAEHVQPYVLFTNYTRYVDEFVSWACAQIVDPASPYVALSCAGGAYVTQETVNLEQTVSDLAWKKHQMPAYHLIADDGKGITLVNIGVGPSNAKTICDHLAVLRPHAWLMIGHCGGLRESQQIGDYVLAHAYLRDDHVLDAVLPPDIPIPSIAEVQRALYDATKAISNMPGEEVKQRLRTGTVVTTDDRNWELRYSASAMRFNLSRAVAVDMESATIAAQGYRFRVPYGTLLCVSDKPLHGEIKLPGQANHFYEGAISEHLQIGIHAIGLLRQEGDKLHSRKLRTFNEPPFR